MCKKRPGPRCSDHSQQRLVKSTERVKKSEAREDELAEKLAAAKPDSKTAARLAYNLELAEHDTGLYMTEMEAAQLEYDATPRGQAEIKAQQAITNLSEDERGELEDRLFVAQARREWQRRVTKKIRELERKHGIAYASVWAREEYRKSNERLAEIQAELAARPAPEKKPRRKKGEPAPVATQQQPAKSPTKASGKLPPSKSRLDRAARMLAKQRLLYALITGDLDRYVLSVIHPENLITRAAYRFLGD